MISRAAAEATRPLGRLGRLTELVVERLLVADVVAASKFGADAPIDDPVREERVLEQVRRQADAAGLEPNAVVMFFRDQIAASKVVQKGLFERWSAHPEEVPAACADLRQVRERLDRLTMGLLRELGTTRDLREEPVVCVERLALASRAGEVRLDALHRRALRVATHSVCDGGGAGVGR